MALKQEAVRDSKAVRDVFEALPREDQEKIGQEGVNKVMAMVDEEMTSLQARLSLIHEGNPNAIRQYREREQRIEQLRAKIAALQEKVAGRDAAIREVRQVWEPALDELMDKVSTAFSTSFRKIGCAGEVRVHKSERGFGEWAAEIRVKFRESENFQVLDNRRQSGGERAVSTVFYLMALQSMARTPFRVVDEINQGMDPRNERVVHHRMVNIACQQHTSQ